MTVSSGKSEFDERRGFAAVESFFKINNNNDDDGIPTASHSLEEAACPSSRRGVGAREGNVAPSSITANPYPQEQRILKIGSKRRRQGYDDDDDDEAISTHIQASHDDEMDDDQGRTAIADDKKKKTSIFEINTLNSSSMPHRKRKGKKERQLQKASVDDEIAQEPIQRSCETESDIPVTGKEGREVQMMQAKQRKRRKKVRSKQKNIRKDHRDVKPAHVLGRRPLTAATRAQLQAPKMMQF